MRFHAAFPERGPIDAGYDEVDKRQDKDVIVEGQNLFGYAENYLAVAIDIKQIISDF